MANILERIHKSTLKFLLPLNPEETYKVVVKESLKLVNANWGSIFVNTSGELRRVYASSQELYGTTVRKKGYTYKGYKSKKPYVIYIEEIENIHPEVKKRGIKSTIFIPLLYKNNSIGVLSIDSKSRTKYTQEQLDALQIFGALATLAIKKTQLYDETKKALELRDLFVALAAHELRTPMTAVNGYIQLIEAKLQKNAPIKMEWIKNMHKESNNLTYLIEELLEINKIKTGKLLFAFANVSLLKIVKTATDRLKFTYPKYTVRFTTDLKKGQDIIKADPSKLLQAIYNIFHNAAKYSPDTKEIEVSLTQSASVLKLTIKDHGVGIHKEDLPYVFEGFYKGKGNHKEGMGLGLFLVKSIIESHNGTIRIFSEKEIGSSVMITIPIPLFQ